MANDDGAFPAIVAGQISVVSGNNRGHIDRAVGREDVIAAMVVSRTEAVVPAEADVAVGGHQHRRIGRAAVAGQHRPLRVAGRVGKPGSQPQQPVSAIRQLWLQHRADNKNANADQRQRQDNGPQGSGGPGGLHTGQFTPFGMCLSVGWIRVTRGFNVANR